jgi:hypothetical protein
MERKRERYAGVRREERGRGRKKRKRVMKIQRGKILRFLLNRQRKKMCMAKKVFKVLRK